MTRTSKPTSLPSHEIEWNQIDLQRIFSVLWRGKIALVGTMLLFGIVAAYLTIRYVEPVYRATAVIEFSQDTGASSSIYSFVGGGSLDRTKINTQLAMIHSFETAQELTQKLNLTQLPEFNAALRQQSLWSKFKIAVIRWINQIQPRELSDEEIAQRELRSTTETVSSRIESNAARDAWTVELSITSKNPALSALLTNTLAEIYIDRRNARQIESLSSTLDWLTQQVQDLEAALIQKEERLKDLHANSNFASEETRAGLARQVQSFRDELEEARLTLARAESSLTERREVIATAMVAEGRSRMTTSETSSLNLLESTVIQSEKTAENLANTYDAVLTRFETLNDALQQIIQLEREVEVAQDLYQTFLTGLQETTIFIGQSGSDSFILSRALPPLEPVSPNPPVNAILAMICAFVILASLLLWRELTTSVFRNAEELADFSNLPVLGETIYVRKKDRRNLVRDFIKNPTSIQAENLRNLRTSIFMSTSKSPEVLLLTSSVPAEGKTILSVTLAGSIAHLGRRVLLIDCDVRRRTVGSIFEKSPSAHGFNDVCSGKVTLEEAIVRDEDLGIDILHGKELSQNPADFFTTDKFRALMADARQKYDHIVLDTPPVLSIADARIISSAADIVLFAVRWDKTTRVQVSKSITQLQSVGVEVAGAILTQVSPKGMKRYGYGEQYGAYAAYGKS